MVIDSRLHFTLQFEALGAVKPSVSEKPNPRPFRPAFVGLTEAFSAQPEYKACPTMRPARAKVGAKERTVLGYFGDECCLS